jgi:hypothetical protein
MEVILTSHKADPSEAVPINRLTCANSDNVVGIEYRWNTGKTSILWKSDPVDNFNRKPILSAELGSKKP